MSTNIKLLFLGDFVSRDPLKINISSEIEKLFINSNVRVCNFEVPVKSSGKAIEKSGPSLYQSTESPRFLEKLGFDVISMANNHMFDYAKEGFECTKNAFRSALLVGAGELNEAYSVKHIIVNGKKIGFLSLTQFEFGVLGLESNESDIGTAWINHPLVNQLIIENKKKVDYLFVLPHAGVEEIDAPLPEWRSRYKEFIDLGADGVIASHPHVPQGWENYKNKPIFYSLGNFYFDTINSNKVYWNKSLMVQLQISDNGKIDYVVHNIKFENNHIVEDFSDEIKDHNLEICSLLSDNKKYNECVNQEVLRLWYNYNHSFIRGLGAFSFNLKFMDMLKAIYYICFRKRNITMLLNNLRCESHRWSIIRAQELLNAK